MLNRRTYEKTENVRPLGKSYKENQYDFLEEASRHQRDTIKNVRILSESHKENQPDFRRAKKTRFGRVDKLSAILNQQRSEYREQLEEIGQARKEAKRSNQQVLIERNEQSLTTGDSYTYEKITQAHLDITTGIHTTEITIKVKKDDGTPVETTTKYSGEASAIARMCSTKMDAFIQNNYHDVLAQTKLNIEEEMAQEKLRIEEEMTPLYAALGTTPDPAARAHLDTERSKRIADVDTKGKEKNAEAEKKASAALRKFLDKYGGRYMDAELLEELPWVQGMEASSRFKKCLIAFSENNLNKSAENVQRITEEISEMIQEMKRIIPASSAALSENHALADSNHTPSSEAFHLSHDPLTLENFEQKIEAYINNPTKGLSDLIYKEISSLATDESRCPESMGAEDKQKIRTMLLSIGLKLVERQYKLDEPLEMLERWERYTASHYGKRLMYERQLVDHLEEEAKAKGEHAAAIHDENNLLEEVITFFRAAGRIAEIHPVSPSPLSSDLLAKLESTQKKAQDETLDQTERTRYMADFAKISLQIKDILNTDKVDFTPAKSLQKALEKLEKARLKSAETRGICEKMHTLTEKLQKLVELEKGRDDFDDTLDMNKTKAIKERDETSLKYLRDLELERVKHFYARELEDHKELNKKEYEIEHFIRNLDRVVIGDELQQKRIATMYWLALFGSGDQAALFALGRDSGAEFNAFMSMLR